MKKNQLLNKLDRDTDIYFENRDFFSLEEQKIIKNKIREGLRKLGDTLANMLDEDNKIY